MQFLNPILLLGLAAAAVPILLHFLSRRKLIDVPFAPLRFLQPTQERQMRRLNLRRLLLLLLRVAIIALVVMAIARPTLTGGLASLVGSGEKVSAVVLVDASASMQAQGTGGRLFDRAREEVASIAGELGGGDEVAVALFGTGFRPLFEEFVRDPQLLLAQLEQSEPTSEAGDLVGALHGALDLLERAGRERHEIYVVSDFQTAEPDTLRLRALQRRLAQAPPTNVFLRRIEPEPFANRQVVEAQPPAVLLSSGATADLGALVRQDGGEEIAVPLFLQVGDSRVGETELTLPGEGTRRHVFPVTLPEAGDLGGSLRLRPDRYPLDDESFFVLPVSDRLPTLVLHGALGAEGERDPLLFLLSALDPGGEGVGRFELEVEAAARFDVSPLSRVAVVIGSDLRDLGAARLAALGDYLEAGGSLLLFAGDPRVRAYTNETLLPHWTDLRLGAFRGEEDVHERLIVAASDHPVFAGFEDDEMATLEETRLRNFYRLSETEGRPLLRYAGGGAAITELDVGRGRLILCGFHTAASAGDLPYSPMFLPLVQRLAGYLATAGWARFGRQSETGVPLAVVAPEGAGPTSVFEVEGPDGLVLPAQLDASASPAKVVLEEVDRPGLYRFLRGGEPFALCAVNVPRRESVRSFDDPEELRAQLGGDQVARFRALGGDDAADAVRDARRGRPIHRWFLVLAGILMVVESLIARRIRPANA